MVHWVFPIQFIQTGLTIQKFRGEKGHALSRAENGESPDNNELRRVNRNFKIIIIAVSLLLAVLSFAIIIYRSDLPEGFLYAEISVEVAEGVLLIIGVLYMRKQLSLIGGVAVKEKLIIIHIINFIAWTSFFTTDNILYIKAKTDEQVFYAGIIGLIEIIVLLYISLFLLYLISKFSLKKPGPQMFDRLLNKKVSLFVYIKNSQLATRENLLSATPIQMKGLASQNAKTIQYLVKSDQISPRIESIAYEYMIIDWAD